MNIEEISNSNLHNNLLNNNNIINNNENVNTALKNVSQIEYKLCGLFSIMYPFSLNFEKDNELDKESFIPKLENPPSWYDITESLEEIDSQSSTSSVASLEYYSDCEMSDISSQSSTSSLFPNIKTQSTTSPNISKSKPKAKKLFIGGIKFDDLLNDQFLKSKRIQKLTQLFHSFGKIDKFDPHWDKGYLFIHYLNPKVSQKVFSSFNNSSKKLKIIQNIKESLKNENIDPKCAPTSSIYIRFPTNNKKQ